jgi:uncharacterized Zn-finger protein
VLSGSESVVSGQLFGSDEATRVASSVTQTEEYIDPSLLTMLGCEPPNPFPSGVSQPPEAALAEQSQSQISLLSSLPSAQKPFPTLSFETLYAQDTGSGASPISAASTNQSSTQSASPSDSSSGSVDAPDGKRKIKVTSVNSVCAVCTRSFSSASRYRHHIDRHSCQAPSECHQCGQPLKHSKDLKRHLGLSNAAPSCPALKAAGFEAKRFACLCSSKPFTRKDTLQRHLRNSAGDGLQPHRCRVCDHSPCKCA